MWLFFDERALEKSSNIAKIAGKMNFFCAIFTVILMPAFGTKNVNSAMYLINFIENGRNFERI